MLKIIQTISFVLLFLCMTVNAQNNPSEMETEKVTKRVGSLMKVKPEYEEQYIILHKYTFPGVLDRIRKSNIRNCSIFLSDGMLFSHFEYVGNDFAADMEAIADPATRDWWKLTDPMLEPLTTRKEGERWAEMEQLLLLDKIFKPSPQAQRIGLVAEIIPGKEEEVKKILKYFPVELIESTYEENFQNSNIYYKDSRLFFYYEYVGSNLRESMAVLNQLNSFKAFQGKLNDCIVQKAYGYWQVMKEVFHTD